MNQVFELWAAESKRLQTASPPRWLQPQVQPYVHAQPSPAQTYLHPQSTHIVSASRLPMSMPVSPTSVPNTPSPMYVSPVQQNAVPDITPVNKTPEYGVVDVLVELPGQAMFSPSYTMASVPEKEPAKKRRSFLSKLF